jgi:phage shock protein C
MRVNTRRLYRSADDRILAGVAGGLADYLDIDPVIVRIIWFVSVFVTGSATFWIYLIMAIVVPIEPAEWHAPSPWAPGGAPIGYQANYTAPGATPGPVPAADPNATAVDPTQAAGADSTGGAAPAANQTGWVPGTPPTPPAPGGWWGNDSGWQGRQDRWQRRAERWQQRAERRAERDQYRTFGGPGLIFGILLILAGGLLVLNQFVPNFNVNLTWPIVIIALGVILVASSVGFRRHD